MGTIAYGLWAAVGGVLANSFARLKVNPLWLAWWAIFPDLLAAHIPIVPGALYASVSGTMTPEEVVGFLYGFGHSLVVFAIVFAIASLALRRPTWELCGWLFHICASAPFHAPDTLFAVPMFWPLAQWSLPFGAPLALPWRLIIGYVLPLLMIAGTLSRRMFLRGERSD